MTDLEQLKLMEVDFSINSDDDSKKLTLILKRCIESKNMICEKLDPRIAAANKAHKGLTALKKETLAPWENVIEKINNSLKDWQRKKEQEAIELQNKINKQLAAQAEEIKQQKLKEAESLGNDWSKELAKEQAEAIVPTTIDLKSCQETLINKNEGQYKRSNWKAKIINRLEVPIEFWIIDEKALDSFAKEFKNNAKLEGVEFYDDFTIVTKV